MANKKFSKISKAARSLARLRWQEDPVMRLAARYGNRGRLQAVSRGKVVGTLRGVGMDEHGLRLFFKALKTAEA